MEGLVLVGALAIGIERLQEFLIGKKVTGWKMQLIAWAASVAVCLLLQVGLFHIVGALKTADVVHAYGDYAITGLMVGLGSNFLHDVFPSLSSKSGN